MPNNPQEELKMNPKNHLNIRILIIIYSYEEKIEKKKKKKQNLLHCHISHFSKVSFTINLVYKIQIKVVIC